MSGSTVETRQRFPIGFYNALVRGDALEEQRPVSFHYHEQLRIGNVVAVGSGPKGKWVRLKIGGDFRTFSLNKIQGKVFIGKVVEKD